MAGFLLSFTNWYKRYNSDQIYTYPVTAYTHEISFNLWHSQFIVLAGDDLTLSHYQRKLNLEEMHFMFT